MFSSFYFYFIQSHLMFAWCRLTARWSIWIGNPFTYILKFILYQLVFGDALHRGLTRRYMPLVGNAGPYRQAL